MKIKCIEENRQTLQATLDAQKTQEERNKKGQFATPFALAKDILNHAKKLVSNDEKIRFLDPAAGTGSFFSALKEVFPQDRIDIVSGFEIDEHYGSPASDLWKDENIDYQIKDFTHQSPPQDNKKYNLIICNPPYVRHHHLHGQKDHLRSKALDFGNMKLNGFSGLYCYFMAIAHAWLDKGGVAGWLVPSEFMDVNYGQGVKEYLLKEVTLLQIHRFDPNDVQFDDALVSSAVVWFRKEKPTKNNDVKFTYGGSIDQPHFERSVTRSTLSVERKWTRFPLLAEREESKSPSLSDFFTIKRGIATGDNKFFVLSREEISEKKLPIEQFRPILPSPRSLDVAHVKADKDGFPKLSKQLFVLDCKLPLEEIKTNYPNLFNYLKIGLESGVSRKYLCSKRKLWYAQETRPSSKFYCTYIGRSTKKGKKPFRFILNESLAIVSNSYLILYPKPHLEKALEIRPELNERVLQSLNNITSNALLDEGRVYGGGLHKMEPKELAKVNAEEIQKLIGKSLAGYQSDLFFA